MLSVAACKTGEHQGLRRRPGLVMVTLTGFVLGLTVGVPVIVAVPL